MFPEALQHRRYQSPDKRNIKLQRRQRAKIRDGIFSTCQAAKGRVGVARLSISCYQQTFTKAFGQISPVYRIEP
ncbi:hypothetical protein PC118_g15839 [Phytophthora cactorum]|uniref:Uncharacterized protein n=1 Tax=Phytophthora cactorum TaxID=29920 RepID=A0A8T1FKC8_9STRA|nr:hypothetical protein PC118_g15839 [Phytophthora cactorum]